MIKIRKSHERGSGNHGWLIAKHSFSFSNYYDPMHMGFKSLRVINEDRVAAKRGFATHGHKDMEILTYVISGQLEHKDSMGNGSIIRPGEVQYMSAGSGVQHSEVNPDLENELHLLQIWILPNINSAAPRYDQKTFTRAEKLNRLCLVSEGETQSDNQNATDSRSIKIRQDAKIYACILEPGQNLKFQSTSDRGQWLQIIRGNLDFNGEKLAAGDAAVVENENVLTLKATSEAEFLLFDLG